MFNISDYLQKTVSKIGLIQSESKNIASIIFKHTNIEIKEEDFEIKEGVVYTKISPLQKNIILIKKEAILKELIRFNIVNIR